jgi:hypothetical protein
MYRLEKPRPPFKTQCLFYSPTALLRIQPWSPLLTRIPSCSRYCRCASIMAVCIQFHCSHVCSCILGVFRQYLAPYVGTAIAEYYRDRGQHALVVFDDLTQHAIAYASLSKYTIYDFSRNFMNPCTAQLADYIITIPILFQATVRDSDKLEIHARVAPGACWNFERCARWRVRSSDIL